MLSFKEFLIENTKFKKDISGEELDHHLNIEDLPLYHGHKGVGISSLMLDDLHEQLQGKNNNTLVVPHYNKETGTPVLFGYHPEKNKFFITHKSAPDSLYYSSREITDAFGDSHAAETLKAGLMHLPKIAPAVGVYGGQLFKAKTPKIVNEARERSTKVAVATTESFKGKHLSPSLLVDYNNFGKHPDITNLTSPVNIHNSLYSDHRKYENYMDHAKILYSKMHYSYPDLIVGHERHLENFTKKSTNPKVDDYVSYMTNKGDSMLINDINAHKEHFQDLLDLHSHLKKMSSHIGSNITHKHVSYHGSPTPSGYSVITPKNKTNHIAVLSNKTK